MAGRAKLATVGGVCGKQANGGERCCPLGVYAKRDRLKQQSSHRRQANAGHSVCHVRAFAGINSTHARYVVRQRLTAFLPGLGISAAAKPLVCLAAIPSGSFAMLGCGRLADQGDALALRVLGG